MVWFLLGLMFVAAGLYLGFETSLTFAYLIVGCLCCVFGIALVVLQFLERPTRPSATSLSPKFISAGATVVMPVMPIADNEQADV